MPYNRNVHHRRSIRLKGYDYSQAGLYFITICVQDRKYLFGKIVNGVMELNDAGRMVDSEWGKIRGRFTNLQLHEYIVMPNHFHAILEIVWATLVVAQTDAIVRDATVDQKGQPQGIGPDNETVDQKGQPQGIGQDNETVDEKGQPQTVAPDNATVDKKGQPQGIAPTRTKTVGDMVGEFQSIATVEYIRGVKQLGWQSFKGKLWQRNYYEHIIRDEQSYQRIADYIHNNPQNWRDDKFYEQQISK